MNKDVERFSSAMAGKTLSGGEVLRHFARDEGNRGFEFGTEGPSFTETQESRWSLEKTSVEAQRLLDRLQKENLLLREEVDKASMFEEILTISPSMKTVLSLVGKDAPTDSIVGETRGCRQMEEL